jgi:drug/metabolite transporter (DMT)-like permease
VCGRGDEMNGSSKVAVVAVALCGMCASWVAMSELLTNLFDEWDKPFFATFVVHVGYAIMFPVGVLLALRRVRAGEAKFVSGELFCCGERSGRWAYGNDGKALKGPPPLYASPVSTLLLLACGFSFLMAALAYCWYLSLPLTSIPANNAIYQSSSAMVYLFSAVFLREEVSLQKSVAVLVSIGGIVLVSFGGSSSDSTDSHPSAVGYLLVVASVVGYALYEVLFARFGEPSHACPGTQHKAPTVALIEPLLPSQDDQLPAGISLSLTHHRRPDSSKHVDSVDEEEFCDEEDSARLAKTLGAWARPPTSLSSHLELSFMMLGLAGVMTALCVWPVLLILDASGVEPFLWPSPAKWRLLLINASLDTIFNLCMLAGILASSPLVVSVGSMMVVPTSIIVDYILHGTVLHALAIVGVVLVVLGFVILKLPPRLFRCGRV